MTHMYVHIPRPLRKARRRLLAAAFAPVLAALSPLVTPAFAAGQTIAGKLAESPKLASATLEQCVTAPAGQERSATFAGEMTLIAGGARMEMRIDLLERTQTAVDYRAVTAPGLGVWRSATPGVRVYKYLKQVTNLAAPASYRASVRFRWLNARGRIMRVAERRSAVCEQPVLPEGTPPASAPAVPGATSVTPG